MKRELEGKCLWHFLEQWRYKQKDFGRQHVPAVFSCIRANVGAGAVSDFFGIMENIIDPKELARNGRELVMENEVHVSAESFSGAGIRGLTGQEEQGGFLFLLEKTGTLLFSFRLEDDSLSFLQVSSRGERLECTVEGFTDCLQRASHDTGQGVAKAAQSLLEAKEKQAEGTVRYHGSLFSNSVKECQLDYRSLEDEAGKVYAVIGHAVPVGAVLGRDREKPAEWGRFAFYQEEEMEGEVNSCLARLQQGEKGILFLVSILDVKENASSQKEKNAYFRAIVEAIQSDFRGEDILGQAGRDCLAVFLCGHVSIDIIERRAQRIIDLCVRVPNSDAKNFSCNIGISATSVGRKRYDAMLKEAREALGAIMLIHGKNQYRLFEEEKY